MSNEWSLSAVMDALVAAVPDRELMVWNDVRRTYAEVAERSSQLAGYLVGKGVGLERERDDLERWERGQVPVALVMNNRPEYLESMYGCFRARAVPFNVNHQYTPAEIADLLAMVGAGAVIYQRSFGPLLHDTIAAQQPLLIEIDDGSDAASLEGSVPYEEALAAGAGVELPTPSPDDLYLVCTGGTTGRPKAVLWRQADIFVSAMAGSDETSAESLAGVVLGEPEIWFAVPPFMHAAAQWTAYSGMHMGCTIVLHDDGRGFDPAAVLGVIERERVNLISIVGDAYARPLIDELRRGDYAVDSLVRIGTGGAMTSTENKEALLDLLPEVMIIDGYGASETGGMAFGATSRAMKMSSLAPGGGAIVLSEDRGRLLEAGEDEVGWTARQGRVPLGYLDDRAATEGTFPIIAGERYAVPGDRARLLDDGTIQMLGRDSMVVNTGGEKVFVEEVEQVLLRHPDVVDVLVVGRPSERFGQEVVAVVQLVEGASVTPAALREASAEHVARFKAPRAVAFVDRVQRHPTGKPDYRWAKEMAEAAIAVGATPEPTDADAR